jgi:hypothetical protein
MENFLITNSSDLLTVSLTPELILHSHVTEKLQMAQLGLSGARGKLIHLKNHLVKLSLSIKKRSEYRLL